MTARALTLRGSHEAHALLIGGPGLDEATLRARVLACWEPGAVAHAIGERVLVVLPSPRRMRAETAPGALVIARHGALATLELEPAALADATGLVEARGGALVVHLLGPETILHVDRWIELDRIDFVDASPLGPPPVPATPPAPVVGDAREAIGGAIPARERAAEAIRAALARGGDGAEGDALPPRTRSLAIRLVEWIRSAWGGRGDALAPVAPRPSPWSRFLSWLRGRASDADAPARGTASSSALARPASPGPLARALEWLRRGLTGVVLRTRLGRVVARRQAEYLARMLELFERGDITEALRWAIPLGGGSDASSGPALDVPQKRDALAISPHRGGPARSLLLGGDLYSLLRDRYLAALRALLARGAIDEAAFVMAELLADARGAVSLLEEHGRLEQAARLAESRELPAAIAVRLWILARQPERAVRLARRHDAFAEAVALLRPKHPELARVLALRWADVLASGGDFAGAVDAVEGDPQGAPLVAAWIDRAVALGGVVGARMLARRAALVPACWADTRDAARALLEDEGEEHAAERLAFAHTLAHGPVRPETRVLARAALRAVVRDRAVGLTLGSDLLSALERLADDGALRADRPTIPPPPTRVALVGRSDALVVHVAAADRGALAVRDAALLPDGRVLVALGDAGVRLIARDGRTVARLDVPADALVVSDSGARAIAVARRGTLDRLARIDVAARRAEAWGHAMLVSFARSFDGHRWLVAEGDGAKLIDAVAGDWRALWTLPRERVVQVARDPGHLALATMDGAGSLELWRYEERGIVLRARTPMEAGPSLAISALELRPEAWLAGLDHEKGVARLQRVQAPRAIDVEGEPLAAALVAHGALVAHASRVAAGVRVDVRSVVSLEPVLHVLLDASERASLRVDGETLVLGDDRGRVLAIDLQSGAVLRDLRVQA